MKLIWKLLKSFSDLVFLVKIDGFSCFPFLMPGKYYLAHNFRKPKPGDFVVFKWEKEVLVKRVIQIKNDYFILKGIISKDNYQVKAEEILGIVKI
ncbi:MAG: S24/S26 family peptidase [Candidatus Aenigmatarchaeota archaeon]